MPKRYGARMRLAAAAMNAPTTTPMKTPLSVRAARRRHDVGRIAARPQQEGHSAQALGQGRVHRWLDVGRERSILGVADDADDRPPPALVFHALADRRLVGPVAPRRRFADHANMRRVGAILRRERATGEKWNSDRGKESGDDGALLHFAAMLAIVGLTLEEVSAAAVVSREGNAIDRRDGFDAGH